MRLIEVQILTNQYLRVNEHPLIFMQSAAFQMSVILNDNTEMLLLGILNIFVYLLILFQYNWLY